MPPPDKTPIPQRVYQDIEKIVRDLETLAQAAKSWPEDSAARKQLRQLRKEMLTAHSSCLKLMQVMGQAGGGPAPSAAPRALPQATPPSASGRYPVSPPPQASPASGHFAPAPVPLAPQVPRIPPIAPVPEPASPSGRFSPIPVSPGGNRRIPGHPVPPMVVRLAPNAPPAEPEPPPPPPQPTEDIADMRTRVDGVSISDVMTVDWEGETDDSGSRKNP
jgi:hypothetical protein